MSWPPAPVINAPGDDPGISNAAPLWRRIHPDWVVNDENLGRMRPTTQAFQNQVDSADCFSIFLGDMITSRGDDASVIITGHTGYLVASITAGLARDCLQRVSHKPTEEEEAHGLVAGLKPKPVKNRFAREAIWIIAPS
jgi:hypothetical protein